MRSIPFHSELIRARKAELVALLDGLRSEVGSIEVEVARALAALGEIPEFDRARGASAVALARVLDEGAGLATAGIAKELRATLAELEQAARERHGGDGDPAEDLDAELARLSTG
jgi:hypothetical protein